MLQGLLQRLWSQGPRYSLESPATSDFACLPLACSSDCSHACCHVQLMMMIASTRDKFVVLGCRHATSLRTNRAKYLQSSSLRSLAALHLARLSASGGCAAVLTPQCWPETTAPQLLMCQSSEGNLPTTSRCQSSGQAKVVCAQHVLLDSKRTYAMTPLAL